MRLLTKVFKLLLSKPTLSMDGTILKYACNTSCETDSDGSNGLSTFCDIEVYNVLNDRFSVVFVVTSCCCCCVMAFSSILV